MTDVVTHTAFLPDKRYRDMGDGTFAEVVDVADAVSLSGNAQGTISTSTSGAQSAALTGGVYDLWSDIDCYIKVAAIANDVTTATGYLLRAGNTIPVFVPVNQKIGAILATGTGTVSYHKVS